MFVILCLMFNSMLTHGYTPDDLLLSTIISIPKDNRGSMSSSDNYRGISMSNSLCKLFDYIFIELNADSLKTDDMQFGFKRNHSTVLCSAIYIETINHYVNEGSNVYSCLIDASKAFDRVHWGRLFKILIERNVSTLFIRLLLDSYIRQKSCVCWGVFKSNYFSLSNGVKQGGVLSPVLFTLYIDKLLIKLKLSGVGCFLNNTYIGALSYADDITLLCPSIRGLNEMLSICCEFGDNCNIVFNPKKTVCIKFGDKVNEFENVYMNNTLVQWANEVKHLGNIVQSTLSDDGDCRFKRSMFIGYVNKLISKFGHLQPDVLINLFNTYCCSFYGSSLWHLHSSGFKSCLTAWNIGARKVLNIPYRAHTWMLGPLMNSIHVKDKLYIRDLKFIYNMKISDNKLAQSCFSFACSDANSIIGNKIAYFRSEYNISVKDNTFSEGVNLIKKSAQLCEELQLTIDHIWSLILVKSNNYSIEGFDLTEINDMISFLTTN